MSSCRVAQAGRDGIESEVRALLQSAAVFRFGSMDRRELLSPIVLFPGLWLLGVALVQVHALTLQRPWSCRMWVVAFLAAAVFVCEGVLAQELVRARGHPALTVAWLGRFHGRVPLGPMLALFIVIGYIELAHQFVLSGQVPLFSSNIDAARVALPGGFTIVLTDLLTVAAVCRGCCDRSSPFISPWRMNFERLARIVDYFPTYAHSANWRYDAGCSIATRQHLARPRCPASRRRHSRPTPWPDRSGQTEDSSA